MDNHDMLTSIQSPIEFFQWPDRFIRPIGARRATVSSLNFTKSALNEILLHTTCSRGWSTSYNVHTAVQEYFIQEATARKGKRPRDAAMPRPRRHENEDERRLHQAFLARRGAGNPHRAAFAWSLNEINRGDGWKSRLKLENFGLSTAKALTSPNEIEIFSFCFERSKTCTDGHIESIGAARHIETILCPVSSFFMSMMWRFTPELGGMSFPISLDVVDSLKSEGYAFP